jgi:cytochrome c-type biogenesis protein CcmH/NrfF
MRLRLGLLMAVATLALLPAVAAARCPRTTLGDVEDEVMCPVCGVPLELATEAPQAQRERAFIQSQIRRCRSKSQIKKALVAQFGQRVLAKPEDKGFDLVAYLVPALGVLLAAAAIAVAALRWRRRPRRAEPAAPQAAESGARLDSDMERYDL